MSASAKVRLASPVPRGVHKLRARICGRNAYLATTADDRVLHDAVYLVTDSLPDASIGLLAAPRTQRGRSGQAAAPTARSAGARAQRDRRTVAGASGDPGSEGRRPRDPRIARHDRTGARSEPTAAPSNPCRRPEPGVHDGGDHRPPFFAARGVGLASFAAARSARSSSSSVRVRSCDASTSRSGLSPNAMYRSC
jgi:hypothetical protein